MAPDGTLYGDAERSPVLVVGDSTMRLNYQTKSAGFSAHLARELGVRPSLYQRNGFHLGQLAKEEPELLQGRKAVVWVQWGLFLCKPNERRSWWGRRVNWSKTRLFAAPKPKKEALPPSAQRAPDERSAHKASQ